MNAIDATPGVHATQCARGSAATVSVPHAPTPVQCRNACVHETVSGTIAQNIARTVALLEVRIHGVVESSQTPLLERGGGGRHRAVLAGARNDERALAHFNTFR